MTEVTGGGVVRRGAGSPPTILLLIRGVDDLNELLGLQGSAANEAAVDIGLGQQLGRVLGIHGAAVLDGHAAGHPGAVQAADGGADVAADLAGLVGSGGLAGDRYPKNAEGRA